MATRETLDLEEARKLITAAQTRADEVRHGRIAVAVADEAGNLVALERQDGASEATTQIAIAKATNAAYFHRDSVDMRELAATRPDMFSALNELTRWPQLPAFGGVLVRSADDGAIRGAIGVSGAPGEDDEDYARTAVDQLMAG